MRAWPLLLALLALLAVPGLAAAEPVVAGQPVAADIAWSGVACDGACTGSLVRWDDGGTLRPGDDQVVLLPGMSPADATVRAFSLQLRASLTPAGAQAAWSLGRGEALPVPTSWSVPVGSDEALVAASCASAASCPVLAAAVDAAQELTPEVRIMDGGLPPLPLLPALRDALADLAPPGLAEASAPGHDAAAPASPPPGAPAPLVLPPARATAPARSEAFSAPLAPPAAADAGAQPPLREASAAGAWLPGGSVAALAPALAFSGLLGGIAARVLARNALASSTRRRLLDAVRADPGCTVGGLARATGLSYKTVAHHVRVLARARLLHVGPGPQPRLFATGHVAPAARAVLLARRAPSAQRILARLEQAPARQSDLAAMLGLAPSTVSEQVRRLASAGLVARTADGELCLARPAGNPASGPAPGSASAAPLPAPSQPAPSQPAPPQAA